MKQFLTVTLFAVFILITSNVNAQKTEDLIKEQNNIPFFLKTDLNTRDGLSAFITETRYFRQIDATITITFNKESRKIISINDSTNKLSDTLISDIINGSNTAAASSCGCVWWDVWCRGECAMCQAGVFECDFI